METDLLLVVIETTGRVYAGIYVMGTDPPLVVIEKDTHLQPNLRYLVRPFVNLLYKCGRREKEAHPS